MYRVDTEAGLLSHSADIKCVGHIRSLLTTIIHSRVWSRVKGSSCTGLSPVAGGSLCLRNNPVSLRNAVPALRECFPLVRRFQGPVLEGPLLHQSEKHRH